MPERWQWMKDPKHSIVENFSFRTLDHLAKHEIQSNTAGLFRRRQEDKILSDFICFPWLIVEHKKAGGVGVKEQCYCQAANAGTAAVMLLQTLSKYVPPGKVNEHIPPVVTMTTVDSTVRVWITYSCKPGGDDGTKYVSKPFSSPGHGPLISM